MSKLKIISAFSNETLLVNNNTFSNKTFDNITLIVAATINVIDLLGNAGRGEEAAEAIIAKEFKG